MPCTYDDFGESARKQAETVKKRDARRLKDLNTLTRMLCATLDAIREVEEPLRQMNRYVDLPEEVKDWQCKHAERDARRDAKKNKGAK